MRICTSCMRALFSPTSDYNLIFLPCCTHILIDSHIKCTDNKILHTFKVSSTCPAFPFRQVSGIKSTLKVIRLTSLYYIATKLTLCLIAIFYNPSIYDTKISHSLICGHDIIYISLSLTIWWHTIIGFYCSCSSIICCQCLANIATKPLQHLSKVLYSALNVL